MLGFSSLPAKFTRELPSLEDRKFDFTAYSFNDIVASTEKRALRIIGMTGGKVGEDEVVILTQMPQSPELQQWSPGIPDRRIDIADPAWSWSGAWQAQDRLNVANQDGCQATLVFHGVAVAVLGRLDQSGGRAEIYLDGQRQERILDSYIVPHTHDNVLWQTYGLQPGRHTLRIVTTGKADPRSDGTQVAIEQAVVYRTPK